MTNENILSSVLDMVAMLTFIKDEEGQTVKIHGDYSEQVFDPKVTEIIRLQDIPAAIDKLLKKTEQLEEEKPVRALFTLLKAEHIINVRRPHPSSSRRRTASETTSNTWW
jgi:hypothetical protein